MYIPSQSSTIKSLDDLQYHLSPQPLLSSIAFFLLLILIRCLNVIKEEVSVNRGAVPTHKQLTHTHPLGLSGKGLPHQAFIMSPDSGIGNLSPSLISLKLQFTWIFVGVLQATSVPADQPDTLSESFTHTHTRRYSCKRAVFFPCSLRGNVQSAQENLKVTFLSANMPCFQMYFHSLAVFFLQ